MNIDELIANKYESLTQGQKKAADFLVDHPVEFGISTIAQIANKINMSETTVIRLSYSLGFKSFSELQRSLKEEYINTKDINISEKITEEQQEEITKSNIFSNLIRQDMNLLKEISNSINQEMLWKAIDLIMNAKKVNVVGCLASYSVAHWFSLKLGTMREEVSLLSSEYNSNFDSVISKNADETVYFLVSMPSYARDTLRIGNLAKEQGAKIITLTDRRLSPVGRISDICLTVPLEKHSVSVISVTSVMSFLNLITSGIEFKFEEVVSGRVQRIKEMHSNQNITIE